MGELMIAVRSRVWRLKLVAQQIVAIGYGSQAVVIVTGRLYGRGIHLSKLRQVQGVRL
jgi:phospholipid/cholesterol/gamma-HCH transport system permease protein